MTDSEYIFERIIKMSREELEDFSDYTSDLLKEYKEKKESLSEFSAALREYIEIEGNKKCKKED